MIASSELVSEEVVILFIFEIFFELLQEISIKETILCTSFQACVISPATENKYHCFKLIKFIYSTTSRLIFKTGCSTSEFHSEAKKEFESGKILAKHHLCHQF